jgi:hypothetical protein
MLRLPDDRKRFPARRIEALSNEKFNGAGGWRAYLRSTPLKNPSTGNVQ